MGTTRLFLTASVEEQWRALAGPWLREQAVVAWKNRLPTVVLTPSRPESFYLRSRLVEEGVPFFGLRFWTPSDLRQFLLGELSPEIHPATQAELRFVVRTCAEDLLLESKSGKSSAVTQGTLASVLREPGPFLRAHDLLLGAGWDPARAGSPYGHALAQKMGRELTRNKIATQPGLHRELLRLVSLRREPLIAKLLLLGFDGAHWPLWDLLQAAVFSASEARVSLMAPRHFGWDVDEVWIGSWEQVIGTSTEIPDGPGKEETESIFADLTSSYEKGEAGSAGDEADLSFLVTPDLASQARAVVLQVVDYLRRDTCTRLGIVFAEANALALEVAAQLRRLGIPLDDGTGSIRPGLFEQRCWQEWLGLQEEPSVGRFIVWMRACEAQGVAFHEGELSARDAAHVLEGALGESLVDDLSFLARHLEDGGGGRRAHAVADLLRNRIALPEEATFEEFLRATRQALALTGWERHLVLLRIDPPAWLLRDNGTISRRVFLGWLKEATDSRETIRGSEGNHFYGKVHLVIYAQMTGQTWSHLVLTGLNEGVWPRMFEAEAFGSRYELAALNQEARGLNRIGERQGGQGEGHATIQAGKGHCLLPLERQDLALRDLCAALEGTSHAACLTAMSTEAGRSLLPSDFFIHAYQAKTGQVLSEEMFRALANVTLAWCRQHDHLFETAVSAGDISRTIADTRIAHDARRDKTQPFGPYEFAYRQPPAQPIQLPCKTWETAWNHPASVWLEDIVGVSSWPDGTLSWQRAVGTWVHRWLKTGLRACAERPAADFTAILREAAEEEASRAQIRARAAGIELYPWWNQVWGRARSIALGLGETLAPHLGGKQILSEFTLPQSLLVALPGSNQADFQLKGRIDLLLLESGAGSGNPALGDFTGRTCWVIDFKTGSAQSLSEKKIEKGMGLQALLYALAVHAQGAGPTAISLLTYDAPLKAQVYLDQALEITTLFRSLDIFHRAGIFGMRGDAQNDYGYAPGYPIATQLIAKDVLDAKWALVHGSGTADEGGDE